MSKKPILVKAHPINEDIPIVDMEFILNKNGFDAKLDGNNLHVNTDELKALVDMLVLDHFVVFQPLFGNQKFAYKIMYSNMEVE